MCSVGQVWASDRRRAPPLGRPARESRWISPPSRAPPTRCKGAPPAAGPGRAPPLRSGARPGPAAAWSTFTPPRAPATPLEPPPPASVPALRLMPPRLEETGVPRSDPAVLLGWSWSRARCSFSARGRRVDMLCWRFCAQRRQPRRRQVCARRDALSSWHEVRRPLPHRSGPSTHARDCRRRSAAPPAPAAPSCRRHTGAPQARLDPPPRTAFAPQARLDPPPRTPLRRRLVSILHPGRACAAGSSRSSTRVESGLGVGSCPRLALRAAWSPSSFTSCALRADRPLQVVPRPTPLSPARASRLLRLSRALRARRPSRPRGPPELLGKRRRRCS